MSGALRNGKRLLLLLTWIAALPLSSGIAAAADRVFDNAEAVEPLTPGSEVPSVTVYTVAAAPVDLSETVRETGALLVFYRGGW
jgi:hypothetical protein